MQAAGIIVYKEIEQKVLILLLQTSYGEHHWTPPKGFVDGNEEPLTAAYRETEEEAGLRRSDLVLHEDFKKTLNYFDPSKQKNKCVIYWLAKVASNEVTVKLSSEHRDFKWLELPEACALAGHSDMAELFQSAADFLKRKHESFPAK